MSAHKKKMEQHKETETKKSGATKNRPVKPGRIRRLAKEKPSGQTGPHPKAGKRKTVRSNRAASEEKSI